MNLPDNLVKHLVYGDLSTFPAALNQYLMIDGNTIDDVDSADRTLLVCATLRNNAQTIQLLLAKGATIDKKDTVSGMTALMYAACFGKLTAITCLLAAAPTSVHTAGEKNWRAVDYALRQGQFKAVQLLIEKGALIDIERTTTHLYDCLIDADTILAEADIKLFLERAFPHTIGEHNDQVGSFTNKLNEYNEAIKERVEETGIFMCFHLHLNLAKIVSSYLYERPELLKVFDQGMNKVPPAIIMSPHIQPLPSSMMIGTQNQHDIATKNAKKLRGNS